MNTMKQMAIAAAIVAGLISGGQVYAAPDLTLSFEVVENNSAAIDFVPQISVEVTFDDIQDTATFEFINSDIGAATQAGGFARIYFEKPFDDFLDFTSVVITDNPNDWSQGASPPDLPGGSDVGFMSSAIGRFDADPPPGGPNGNNVRAGQSISFEIDLLNTASLADLELAILNGEARFGVHIISLADGESETYVTTSHMVPVPPAVAVGALGMIAVAAIRRKRSPKA